MMTADAIIDELLIREGQGFPPYLAPGDPGGRTSWGIAERFHPEAWVNGPPTRDAARAIYLAQYVAPFNDIPIPYERLRVALIDDGVLSGVETAIKRLQTVLEVPVDGVFGHATRRALLTRRPTELLQAFVVERVIRLARLVQQRPLALEDLVGWQTRALSFLPVV